LRRTEDDMEEMKKLRKGEVIFREGDFLLWMYGLLFGTVALYVDYGTPEEVLVASTAAPAFFGGGRAHGEHAAIRNRSGDRGLRD
jgi:CRP-like cAMP-binding protein